MKARSVTVALALLAMAFDARTATADVARWERLSAAGVEASDAGHLEEAERQLSEALREAESWSRPDPRLVLSLGNLADIYRALGQDAKAEALYTRAVAAAQELRSPRDALLILQALKDWAWFYQARRQYGEAAAVYARAVETAKNAFGANDVRVAGYLNAHADAATLLRHYDEAAELLHRALLILEATVGPRDAAVAAQLNGLALLLRVRGRDIDAAGLTQRAADILRSTSEDVERQLQAAISARERILGRGHPSVAKSLNDLVMYLQAPGRYGEALAVHERVLDITSSESGHPFIVLTLEDHAALSRKAGRETEARIFEARAAALRPPTAARIAPESSREPSEVLE